MTCRAPGCYQFFCLLNGDLQATLLFPSFASPAARGEQLWDSMEVFRRAGLISWRRLLLGLAAVVVASIAGCGGSSSLPYNATPVITLLYPDYVYAGASSFTLYISGTGFMSTTTVYWNGTLLNNAVFNATTTQMEVTIPASDVASAGNVQITASNPPPGGGMSLLAATFEIKPPLNPVPSISSLSPGSVLPGSSSFTLTVNGTNFVSNSVVAWNGNPRATTYVPAQTNPATPAYLTAQILASDVATGGSAEVTVSNPAPGGGVSPPAVFTIGNSPGASRKFPQVVSVNANGGAANGQSAGPAISADGRYVAFYSEAKNLIAEGASGNIFVRDTCLGAANCTPQTIAVDIAPDGSAPNGPAGIILSLSSTGRFVAFSSEGTNLVPGGETNGHGGTSNVFIRDLCVGAGVPTGCVPHTDIVSVAEGGQPANADSSAPSLSADGQFVAFESEATNLVPALSISEQRVYVRDLSSGRTLLVSTGDPDSTVNYAGMEPSISGDGRHVAFSGWSLDPRFGGSALQAQVFVKDTCLGPSAPSACVPSLIKVSTSPDGANGNSASWSPVINGDGRFVVFESLAGNLTPDASGGMWQALLRDTCLGSTTPSGCEPSTSIVSVDNQRIAGDGDSKAPYITRSGRYVSFISRAQSLSSQDPSTTHAYVRDTCLGVIDSPCVPSTHIASIAPVGVFGDESTMSRAPVTDDGRFAVFFSFAKNLATPVSEQGDVFLTTAPH